MRDPASPATAEAEVVARALRRTAPRGCVYAGLYAEETLRVGMRYADSRVADVTHNQVHGASVRWIGDREVRYRSANVADLAGMLALVDGAPVNPPPAPDGAGPSTVSDDGDGVGVITELSELAGQIDATARSADPRIVRVLVDLEHHRQRIRVVTAETGVIDHRDLLYLTVRAVARTGDRLATSYYTPGTSAAADRPDPVAIGREAADRALLSLSARPAPIRHLPVVVGPGRGMVLIHEACCHPLEGDEVLRGSVYAGRIGSRVADGCLTIDDDPTVAGAVGAYRLDDEGTEASRTTLVEAGVLTSYLTDQLAAARLGVAPTGNGRREGYHAMPLPRMSNTCVRAGGLSPESIIADTRYGLYAQHVGGGEVVESTGDFVFRVTNGFLIENGRLTDPVCETTVSGNGAAVLAAIDAIGDDVRVGAAKCGKYGQTLPVGVVGPTLRIRSLLVGGTDR